MATVLPAKLPMRVFAITFPAITVFTILLVFSLEDIVDFLEHTAQTIAEWMRNSMRHHRRVGWKKRAEALLKDRTAIELLVKRRRKRSTHWMYVIYVLEVTFVTLPVNEVRSALALWGLGTKGVTEGPWASFNSGRHAQLVKEIQQKYIQKPVRQLNRKSIFARSRPRILSMTFFAIFYFVRFLCLAIWLPLLVIEIVILYLYTVALFVYTRCSQRTAYPLEDATVDSDVPFDWTAPLHMLGLSDVYHYPALTLKERAAAHWRRFRARRILPKRHAILHDPNDEPRPLGHSLKRMKPFFVPATRTVANKPKRGYPPMRGIQRQTARTSGFGGLDVDIDHGILEQGQGAPNNVTLTSLGTIVEDIEQRT
jgi:hypothetical protein